MKQRVIGLALKVLVFSTATGSVALAETITGWVDHAEQYALSTGVDGVIKDISVKEGERVLPGTLLLSLKDNFLKADVLAAKSELSLEQEELNEATRSFERDQSLFDEGSLATVELDLAKIRLLRRQSRVARLNAELAAAMGRLEMSRIIAPFAGAIVQLNVTKGQNVAIASLLQPMLVFASSILEVKAQMPAGSENTLAVSTAVKINANGEAANGIVRAIRIANDVQHLSISIESSQAALQPGQLVEIMF